MASSSATMILYHQNTSKPRLECTLLFVVDNVDKTYEKALKMKTVIVQEPHNEFYGQRRFLVKDPDGCLIDICSPWEQE